MSSHAAPLAFTTRLKEYTPIPGSMPITFFKDAPKHAEPFGHGIQETSGVPQSNGLLCFDTHSFVDDAFGQLFLVFDDSVRHEDLHVSIEMRHGGKVVVRNDFTGAFIHCHALLSTGIYSSDAGFTRAGIEKMVCALPLWSHREPLLRTKAKLHLRVTVAGAPRKTRLALRTYNLSEREVRLNKASNQYAPLEQVRRLGSEDNVTPLEFFQRFSFHAKATKTHRIKYLVIYADEVHGTLCIDGQRISLNSLTNVMHQHTHFGRPLFFPRMHLVSFSCKSVTDVGEAGFCEWPEGSTLALEFTCESRPVVHMVEYGEMAMVGDKVAVKNVTEDCFWRVY